MEKKYYAAHSYMGTDYTFNSPCWVAYQFNSKADRDAWLEGNEYKDGKRVAQSVTRKSVEQIVGRQSESLSMDIISDVELWHLRRNS
jgi:hypothetical protein